MQRKTERGKEEKKEERKNRVNDLRREDRNVVSFPARGRYRSPLAQLAEIWVSALVRGN